MELIRMNVELIRGGDLALVGADHSGDDADAA